jgi:hypothetical protein
VGNFFAGLLGGPDGRSKHLIFGSSLGQKGAPTAWVGAPPNSPKPGHFLPAGGKALLYKPTALCKFPLDSAIGILLRADSANFAISFARLPPHYRLGLELGGK